MKTRNIARVLLMAAACFCLSCNEDTAATYAAQTTPRADCKPTSYGYGVYYFPCVEARFGLALAAFRADVKEPIEAVAGNGTDIHGYDRGYWVVVQLKPNRDKDNTQ